MQDYINQLPDKLLEYIFSFLPPNQRFEVEKVCKRWNMIGREGWYDLNELKINECVSTYTIHSFLKRCGRYLEKLEINISALGQYRYNINPILYMVIQFCESDRLKILKISRELDEKPLNFTEKLVYKKAFNPDRFPNLQELQLYGVDIINEPMIRSDDSLKGLERIVFQYCDIGEDFIERIESFRHLRELVLLGGCWNMKDKYIRQITRRCDKIEILRLNGINSLTTEC